MTFPNPPAELGDIFETADHVQVEYMALHEEMRPRGLMWSILKQLHLVSPPDWQRLRARLDQLHDIATSELETIVARLKSMEARDGSIPRVVNLRYQLFVRSVNCIEVLKGLHDNLWSDNPQVLVMGQHARQYKKARKAAAEAAAKFWNAAHPR